MATQPGGQIITDEAKQAESGIHSNVGIVLQFTRPLTDSKVFETEMDCI